MKEWRGAGQRQSPVEVSKLFDERTGRPRGVVVCFSTWPGFARRLEAYFILFLPLFSSMYST
jgi:hypothetical protein